MKKLRNSRGETLIEVLASILISALSVALLFTCVMTSSKIDEDAKKADKTHYNALSGAEARVAITPQEPEPEEEPEDEEGQEGTAVSEGEGEGEGEVIPEPDSSGTVTIKKITPVPESGDPPSAAPPITVYGGAGMFSYGRQP